MSSDANQTKLNDDKKPDESEAPQKSKADLRRERRELQEAQRAKKSAGVVNKPAPAKKPEATGANQKDKQQSIQKSQSSQAPPQQEKKSQTSGIIKNEKDSMQPDTTSTKQTNDSDKPKDLIFETAPVKLKLNKKKDKDGSNENLTSNKPKLFHHFDQYKRDYSITEKLSFDNSNIHPEFIKIGLEFAHDKIVCSNARCIAFLNAFKQFLNDYKGPNKDKKTLSEHLESKLKLNINFLTQCRPLSISMGNAIKEMKQIISHFSKDITESEAKKILTEEIDKFIEEKILLAADTISKYILANGEAILSGTSYARSKITNKDCILVYGYSSLVMHILLEAKKKFPDMSVVVVDSRPKLRGKQTLEKLIKHKINCSYVLINGISFIMNRVSKVILGAHALLANGYVMGQIGSSQIALVAKSFNVPVVVCCETYKFCEKVQTDALVNNELGNPFDLLKNENKSLENENSFLSENENLNSNDNTNENITLLNLTYDVTPPDLISCVVTDMGMLPCTSVPVVLRLKNRDLTGMIVHKKTNQIENESENR